MTDDVGLPEGMGLVLDPGVRRIDGGMVLVGGAPLRLVRVTAAGSDLVDRWAAGDPVPTSGGGARLARRLLATGLAHPRLAGTAAPFTPADVAVVMPVRGTAAQVEPTLAALGPVGEVTVVDDGSDPPLALGSPLGVEPRTSIVRHDVNRGPGAARETGWRGTGRPVVAFVDAEVIPGPGWLEALLAHFADPQVVAVAPRVLPEGEPLDMGSEPAVVRPGSVVPYVPTALLVVRRDALEAVDGFDPDLRFGEDVDLVWRLAAAGRVVRYDPSVTAVHPRRPDARARVRQAFDYGSSAGPLAVRHGAAVAPLRVSGWSAVAWGLAALGHPGAGVLVAAGSTAALARKLDALDHPVEEALALAGRGHLYAARALAQAVRRTWLPLALGAAVVSRRARPAVAAAVLGPAVADLARRRDPLRHLAADAAYCAGVWAGSWRARTLKALLPASAGTIDPPRARNR